MTTGVNCSSLREGDGNVLVQAASDPCAIRFDHDYNTVTFILASSLRCRLLSSGNWFKARRRAFGGAVGFLSRKINAMERSVAEANSLLLLRK